MSTNFDLFIPAQFGAAVKQKFARKFTFGPIEFNDLDKQFDAEAERKKVIDCLEKSTPFANAGNNVCVHGYKVEVKERTMKRGTSMLKHSRFLQNMEVLPIWPPEPEKPDDTIDVDNENAQQSG